NGSFPWIKLADYNAARSTPTSPTSSRPKLEATLSLPSPEGQNRALCVADVGYRRPVVAASARSESVLGGELRPVGLEPTLGFMLGFMLGSGLAEPVNVEAVDGVEVIIVVDNFVDVLMAGAEGVHRYLAYDFADRDQLVAEHGFSALVTVRSGQERSSLLYDGGLTPAALGRHLDVLEIPAEA